MFTLSGSAEPCPIQAIKSIWTAVTYCLKIQNVLNAQEKAVWGSFIDLAGRSSLKLGLPRSLGQVYAAIYLSSSPLGLEDLMDSLHISKGNASMSVRQLAEWGAVRCLWVKGDRKDYYEATEKFSDVVRHFFQVILKPRVASTSSQLQGMSADLKKLNGASSPDGTFMRERIVRLENFHKKISKVFPLVEKLL
jgi:DNA-binding transcriptional regulator GbsR (MarR family)